MPGDAQQQLAAELGIDALPQDEQEPILAQFGEVALKAATAAALEKLPEGKHEEFSALAEGGDAAKLQSFLDAEVPGHEAFVRDAIVRELARLKESVTE